MASGPVRGVPFRAAVDVMLILTDADRVFLARRSGTGYRDGWWNLPSGKLEDQETAMDAVMREAHEEIGISLRREELDLAGVVHCRNPEGESRVGMMFAATYNRASQGEPHNAEPHKCSAVGWFSLGDLPEPFVPYCAAGLDLLRDGRIYREVGWSR